MLSSSVSTPFSVRDILSEDQQQLGVMDCYAHHQNQIQQQHVHQDYYSYNVAPENSWEMEKFKEQPMSSYQHYSDLNHVHQLSQVVPPYQETSITEDGKHSFAIDIIPSSIIVDYRLSDDNPAIRNYTLRLILVIFSIKVTSNFLTLIIIQ
jgi:hypothetical protein